MQSRGGTHTGHTPALAICTVDPATVVTSANSGGAVAEGAQHGALSGAGAL